MHIEELINRVQPINRGYIKIAQKRFDNLIKPVGSLAQLEKMTSRYAAILGSPDKDMVKVPAVRLLLLWGGLQEQGLVEAAFREQLPLQTLAAQVKAKVFPQLVLGETPLELLEEGAMLTGEYIGEEKAELVAMGTLCQPIEYSKWHSLLKLSSLEQETGYSFEPETYEHGDEDCACGHHHHHEAEECGCGHDHHHEAEDGLKAKLKQVAGMLAHLDSPCVSAMTGGILQAAGMGLPVVLDGVETCLAAWLAAKLNPAVLDYCYAGHIAKQEGMEELLTALGLEAPLRLSIPNSLGFGALTCMQVFDAGIKAYTQMETFEEAGVHAEQEEYSLKKQEEEKGHE